MSTKFRGPDEFTFPSMDRDLLILDSALRGSCLRAWDIFLLCSSVFGAFGMPLVESDSFCLIIGFFIG